MDGHRDCQNRGCNDDSKRAGIAYSRGLRMRSMTQLIKPLKLGYN
jgi:hypothetical protein